MPKKLLKVVIEAATVPLGSMDQEYNASTVESTSNLITTQFFNISLDSRIHFEHFYILTL